MTPAGVERATSRFVAQHLNHCATAVPHIRHTVLQLFNVLVDLCPHLKEITQLPLDIWMLRTQEREEITRGWRKLRNDKLNNLYSTKRILLEK